MLNIKLIRRVEGKLMEFIWRSKNIGDYWSSFLTAMREIHVDNS